MKVRIVLYFAHVNKVRNGYYNPIKGYIFDRPPDYKINTSIVYILLLFCERFEPRSHFVSKAEYVCLGERSPEC